MDKTQLYIIRQSSLNRATDLYSKQGSWDEQQIIDTAKIFEQYVIGEDSQQGNGLPPLPKKDEETKSWLNLNTPDYNTAIELIKKGYTIQNLRNQYKISKKVENELNKI